MKHLFISFSLFFSVYAWGQDVDNRINKITPFIQALVDFSEYIPQEKVYLHFDNTSYYQGDNIWFKCYVVTSGLNQLSSLSKTLYVELLNPGGEVVDKRILKIENGQCHGDFMLNHLPFYSGFYEVRAYTKYMLNFGDDIIFSRLLPVFNKPQKEGNYEEKKMLKYGAYGPQGSYPMRRKRPEKGKTVNLRFFPEGGNLIQGISSRIAFEATDETGNPITVTGVVMDDRKQEVCRFAALHEGRGVFTYTPAASQQKNVAEVEYSGKKYRFDLPAGLPGGVVMEVDNLSLPDRIGISLRKNENTPFETLGLVVLTGSRLQSYAGIHLTDDKAEINFQIDKTHFPSGVSQIVLFNDEGEILCDRLVFTGKNDFLDIHAKPSKKAYNPHELVEMEFSVAAGETNRENIPFSLSIREAANEIESKQNILTDLLLMSEIKGYVHNPSWYFEEEEDTRRAALDVLLMVQGWRRYSWKQMAGIETVELKYPAEQGIETTGQIISMVRQIPKPNVDVGLLLHKKAEEAEDKSDGIVESFVTDDQGRFSFRSDVSGRWNLILAVTEKRKKKDHRILLDRAFSPEPKRYRYADLQVSIAKNNESIRGEETPGELEEDLDAFFVAYADSLAKAGITEKVHVLPEVTVKGKKNTREQDVLRNRSTSAVYYDMASELDDIYDRGKYIGDDIHQMLLNSNTDFHIRYGRGWGSEQNEWLLYKNKMPLFVINYERTNHTDTDYNKYKRINLAAIKSIYINETTLAKCQYADLRIPCIVADDVYSFVVFIETYPEEQVSVDGAKGVRKTWLEGYSPVKEFYSPDYSILPPEPDYRRTLYWNPSVTPDENGLAKISFYNNSTCRDFNISAETVTSQGMIGIYKRN